MISEEEFADEFAELAHEAGIDETCALEFSHEVRTSPRSYADVDPWGLHFRFAPQVLELPWTHRRGLIMHEIGHVLARDLPDGGTEDDADDAAFAVFGEEIRYDKSWPGKGLQCVRCHARPNPYQRYGGESLASVIWGWQNQAMKLYDPEPGEPHGYFSVEELWPYREYTWRREDARRSPEEWDELVESIAEEGIREPLWVSIGAAGGAKVGEGNHRLAIARELGIREVPVKFSFVMGRVQKTRLNPAAHRYLSLSTIKKYEPLMKRRGVSEVARSPRGFLTAYKRAGGKASRLPEQWKRKREAFIARHMAQMKNEALFKNGEPSRRHLALIAWAYSPAARRL